MDGQPSQDHKHINWSGTCEITYLQPCEYILIYFKKTKLCSFSIFLLRMNTFSAVFRNMFNIGRICVLNNVKV